MTSLTRAEIKPYLGQMQNVNDDELDGFIASAEQSIVDRVGPLVETAQSVVVAGRGDCRLSVPVMPIRSVTSVTGKSGDTYTPERFAAKAGVIYFETALSESYYTVVYAAGHADVAANIPAPLVQAVAWQTQLDWQSMRGKAQRGPDDLRVRIAEKLAPYVLPGFA